jgi:hypothetical protein
MLCRLIKMMLPLNLNPQLTSALRENDSTLENITDTYSKSNARGDTLMISYLSSLMLALPISI